MDDQDGEPTGDDEPNWAKRLRADNKRLEAEAATAKAEAAAVQREAMFDRVGVPKSGTGALFRTAYDGEIAEEAIRSKATEYELIETPRHTPASEREEFERASDALAGPTGTQDFAKSLEAPAARMAEAKSIEEIESILEEYGLEAS